MILFDIQELLEMESSRRFDAIFAAFDVQLIFQLFLNRTLRGAPGECQKAFKIKCDTGLRKFTYPARGSCAITSV